MKKSPAVVIMISVIATFLPAVGFSAAPESEELTSVCRDLANQLAPIAFLKHEQQAELWRSQKAAVVAEATRVANTLNQFIDSLTAEDKALFRTHLGPQPAPSNGNVKLLVDLLLRRAEVVQRGFNYVACAKGQGSGETGASRVEHTSSDHARTWKAKVYDPPAGCTGGGSPTRVSTVSYEISGHASIARSSATPDTFIHFVFRTGPLPDLGDGAFNGELTFSFGAHSLAEGQHLTAKDVLNSNVFVQSTGGRLEAALWNETNGSMCGDLLTDGKILVKVGKTAITSFQDKDTGLVDELLSSGPNPAPQRAGSYK